MTKILVAVLASALAAGSAAAQPAVPAAPPRTPYGEPLTLDMAKKVVAAAEAEAAANGWSMAIAVVDTGSNLVVLHRLDQTQIGPFAWLKARLTLRLIFAGRRA